MMIKIDKLHKSYIAGTNRLHVLKGLDLEISAGEMVPSWAAPAPENQSY